MAESSLQVTPGSGTKVDGFTTTTNGNFRQAVVIADPSTDANTASVDPTYGVSVNVKGINGAAPNIAQETGGNLATLAGVVSGAKAAVKNSDGDFPTFGAKADTAITDSTTTNTHMSFLKGLVKILADVWDSVNHRLNVYLQNSSIAVTGTFWQATQPVSGTVTANAGTGTFATSAAQSGTWTVQPGNTANTTPWLTADQAATSGGYTPYSYIAAASANQDSQNVKGSAGQIGGLYITNTNASVRYVKIYDKATAPTSADTPKLRLMVPGNSSGSGGSLSIPAGSTFASGIGFRITTGIADNDTGAATANDVIVNFFYK